MTASSNESPNIPKKVLLETWGCQMNVADSEDMLRLLRERNYVLTDKETEADLILLNTCHIREKAKHKVLSRLGILKELKNDKPELKIAVTGCVAQAEGKRLLTQAPGIDLLLGPGKIKELPQLLATHDKRNGPSVALGFDRHVDSESDRDASLPVTANPTVTGRPDISRFVTIQQGCDNFCTFCVVPFTRGRELSSQPATILAQAEALIREGARELTLLGQNVNSYGLDLVRNGQLQATADGPFVDLLRQVCRLPGLARLRFTTSNPHDFTAPLAELFANESVLGKYLHLPVQSGDDTVLGRMRRKVTVVEYKERIAWLRNAVPDVALSTDLIVGFPGETDAQFENTLQLVSDIGFSFLFSFKYSARKNTAAARFADQVSEEVKDKRLKALNELQERITLQQVEAELGKTRRVLCHYESRKEPGIFYGRTPQFRLVRIASSRDLTGQLVDVRISSGNKTALIGELI